MKKNNSKGNNLTEKVPIKHFLLIMRISIILVFACVFCSMAETSYTQNARVTINKRNSTLREVLNEIEKQTDYLFIYNNEINTSEKVSVKTKHEAVSDVLNSLLKDKEINYSMEGNHIILSAEKKTIDQTMESVIVQQQKKTITGTVVDAQGEPIIGANIVEIGTTNGTVTDFDGNFSLNVEENATIQISYIGYLDQIIDTSDKASFKITLLEDTQSLDELVVVGYGVQKKVNLTGSVATISSEELTTTQYASTSNALSGRLPGLITKQSSGLPGSDASTLSIRGFDSPLIIVDGVEGSFNNIDANEIESISILKDASAAVYGARAGNGVILVTTKRGNIGKPTITFNSTLTFQGPTNLMKMANAGQYTEMVRESHIQAGQPESTSRFSLEDIEKYYAGNNPDFPSTDWFDYLIRDWTPQNQTNLSLRGGNEAIKYYGFVGYLDQQSMIKRGGGNYNRYNIRSNIDATILPNLFLTVDISSIIENRRFPWRSDEGNDSVWQDIWNTEPIYPAELPDPTKVPYANGGGTGGAHISSNRDLSGTRDTDNYSTRIQGSLKWDIEQLPGLSAKYSYTLEKWYSDYKFFQSMPDTYTYNHASDTYTKLAKGIETKLDQNASKGHNWQSLVSLEYQTNISQDHNLSAQIIYELYEQNNSWISASRSDFDTNMIPYLFAGGLKNQTANGSAGEMGRASLIGRLNYDYRQKYLIEGTFRYDGSANYPKDSRWGLFPSISAAWRLSEESFIKNSSSINNLKIRLGFSKTGNDAIYINGQQIRFPYLAGYNFGNVYNIGGTAKSGLHPTGIATTSLSWEEMTIYNSGIDFGFFKNKLFGELDLFYRLREKIPGRRSRSLPDTFGATLPVENLNSITTRGFEFMIGHQGQYRNLQYKITGNLSWARSKWKYFDEPDYEDPDDIRINKKTGKWIDIDYGYKSNGLFTSIEQIEQLPYFYIEGTSNTSFLHEGDVILLNTNDDNILNWRDQQEIGKGNMPNWTGGINMDLYYKSFDFSMLWQGAFGFSHRVVLKRGTVFPEIVYNERWTYENNNSKAIVPRLGGASTNDWGSDYNMVDGDYLRLKSLAFGYTIPNKWIAPTKISNLRLFLTGTNLLTFSKLTKYKIDPEANSGSGGQYYPQMRTIAFGLNISL